MARKNITQPPVLTEDHKKVLQIMGGMARDIDAVYKKYERIADRTQPYVAGVVLSSKVSGIKDLVMRIETDMERMKRTGSWGNV